MDGTPVFSAMATFHPTIHSVIHGQILLGMYASIIYLLSMCLVPPCNTYMLFTLWEHYLYQPIFKLLHILIYPRARHRQVIQFGITFRYNGTAAEWGNR